MLLFSSYISFLQFNNNEVASLVGFRYIFVAGITLIISLNFYKISQFAPEVIRNFQYLFVSFLLVVIGLILNSIYYFASIEIFFTISPLILFFGAILGNIAFLIAPEINKSNE